MFWHTVLYVPVLHYCVFDIFTLLAVLTSSCFMLVQFIKYVICIM